MMADTRAEPTGSSSSGRQSASAAASGRPPATEDGQTGPTPQTQLIRAPYTDGGQAVQLDSGHGKTVIADTVVAKIAGAAAREVEGVHELIPVGATATLAGFAGRLARTDQRSTGVSVEVGTREAAVDLNMSVDYGVSIPQVAEAVRQNIMERVRGMTGLAVKEVNIHAADLYFPEQETARVQ
jgi:uncharacterized alkaline shock family protein YloU